MASAPDSFNSQLEQALDKTRTRFLDNLSDFIIQRISKARISEIVDDNIVQLFIDHDDIPLPMREEGATLSVLVPYIRKLSPNITAALYNDAKAIVIIYCPDKDKMTAHFQRFFGTPVRPQRD